MKKALTLIAILCMAAMLFAGCDAFPLPGGPTEPPATEEPTTHTHTPETDDGDCTTAILCAECGEEAVEAKQHVPATDDGDCTTAVKCANEGCQHICVEAKEHAPATDDGDCTTAVKCTNENCQHICVEAKEHTPETDDGDCTTAVKCANCEKNAKEANAAHTAEADDGDVTTPVKCENCEHIFVAAKTAIDLTIPTFENGAVTTDKKNYAVGDTVNLTITPSAGYAQKLYINGAPLLDNGTGSYSFVAEEGKSYAITGGFVVKNGWFWTADWDVKNQGHFAHAPAHGLNDQGKQIEATGDLVPTKGTASGMSVLVTDPSHGTQANYAIVLKMHFTNGKKAEVRLIDEKADGKYCLQTLGNNILGNWNKHYNLTDAENQAVMNGEGVWYSMTLNGATLCLSINDTVVKAFNLSADGITSVDDIDQVKLVAYNFTYAVDVPYIIYPATAQKPPVEEGDITLTIPTFANGSVVPQKKTYKAGETISLIIAPTKGYSQKLYINGEPLMLDWKTDVYTFVAEEGKTYEITGSFVPSLNTAPKDANRWDVSNQAHGVLNTYYTKENDSWWMEIKGEYESFAVKTKNYLSREESMDNDPAGHVGYSVALYMTVGGKTYAFRIYNDKGTYAYSRSGATGVAGWGNWKRLDDAAVAAIGGDGVDFKLERTGANTLTISINGVVVDTYTIDGATEADKVTAVGISQYGNKGARVEIPFELK